MHKTCTMVHFYAFREHVFFFNCQDTTPFSSQDHRKGLLRGKKKEHGTPYVRARKEEAREAAEAARVEWNHILTKMG